MKKSRWMPFVLLVGMLVAGCDSQLTNAPAAENASGLDAAVRLPIADQGGAGLQATMSGAEEAPGPGDPDGTGTARFTLNPGHETVCYELTVSGIDPATAAHIHIAPAGSPGPVVVPLIAPSGGSSTGCVEGVSRQLIKQIIQNPSAYYVNVHNASFPGGAVRGQLSR